MDPQNQSDNIDITLTFENLKWHVETQINVVTRKFAENVIIKNKQTKQFIE